MTSDKDTERVGQPTATSPTPATDAIEGAPTPAPKPVTATPTDPSAKSSAPAPPKPVTPPKPAAPPPAPFVAEPSLPVSMENSPDDAKGIRTEIGERRFDGELEEDFVSALSRVVKTTPRTALLAALKRGLRRLVSAKKSIDSHELAHTERKVAFDGFRSELHDEKIERDRRYGTVYTVSEAENAYFVRLELPRRVPTSALKLVWNLPDEMPDYDYSLSLSDGVLSIRGAVPTEALRRLSYVSPSFPSDFMTRIEFAKPVGTFRHRLRDKALEIIVFKRAQGDVRSAA